MLALHRSKSDSDPSWFAACPDLAAIREPAWLEAAKAAQRHNIRARQRLFSDNGATHDLRGRRQGTIYDISNSAVVLIRDDGRAVAQGVGTTTITVRNGALFFEVPIIVRGGTKMGR